MFYGTYCEDQGEGKEPEKRFLLRKEGNYGFDSLFVFICLCQASNSDVFWKLNQMDLLKRGAFRLTFNQPPAAGSSSGCHLK